MEVGIGERLDGGMKLDAFVKELVDRSLKRFGDEICLVDEVRAIDQLA